MPFSGADLNTYLTHHALSDAGAQYLRGAAIAPSRDVGTTGYAAVAVELPSRKMGTTICVESRRGEAAYVVQLERDHDVLAFYEQPPMVDCRRRNRRGVIAMRSYTPDFLVLRRDGPVVIQIKTEQRLAELVLAYPTDWVGDGDIYRDLPAEQSFATIGLRHEVVSTASLSPTLIANAQLLMRVEWSNPTGLHKPAIEQLLSIFRPRAVMTLAELATALGLTALTPLLALVADGSLHANLDLHLLADPSSCPVALLPQLLKPEILGDALPRITGATIPLSTCPPLKQAETGLAKLERWRQGNMPERTLRRHRAEIAKASAEGMTPFQVLSPKTHRSGNRNRKRPHHLLLHAERLVRDCFGSSRRLTPSSIYRLYREDVGRAFPNEQPLSRQTIAKLILRLRSDTAYSRGGKRMANAVASPTDVHERVQRPMRPFELATCDHYLADIHCVLFRTDKRTYTGKPWLTVLRDVHTRAVLAMWVGFRAPSRVACAMVIRSCLRRHGRLPEAIVVDRGSEFRSVYFGALLAHCGIAAIYRPSGHPRYGSEAERFFGAYKSQWLNLRPGNTALHVESRSVSGSHSAAATAELDVAETLKELWAYCDWSHTCVAPGMTVPPTLAMEDGLIRFPFSGIQMAYDDAFELATAVEAHRIKLDPARGLQIGKPFYWHPVLAQSHLRASQLEVRCDPEDHTQVYVRIDDCWHIAVSSQHAVASKKSRTERIAASVIALDGATTRNAARMEAEDELIRLVRQADEELATKRELDEPALPSETEEDFEQLSCDMPAMTYWRDAT